MVNKEKKKEGRVEGEKRTDHSFPSLLSPPSGFRGGKTLAAISLPLLLCLPPSPPSLLLSALLPHKTTHTPLSFHKHTTLSSPPLFTITAFLAHPGTSPSHQELRGTGHLVVRNRKHSSAESWRRRSRDRAKRGGVRLLFFLVRNLS